MELKIAPRTQFPDRGPCVQLHGDWVTEAVWGKVAQLLRDNYIDSPVYQARTKASAFFQGGHNNSQGEWVLIEFWTSEEKCQDFLEILNKEVNTVIDADLTKILLVAKSNNDHDIKEFEEACALIAEDTGCKSTNDQPQCRLAFLPEDNLTYEKVSGHVQRFQMLQLHMVDN